MICFALFTLSACPNATEQLSNIKLLLLLLLLLLVLYVDVS